MDRMMAAADAQFVTLGSQRRRNDMRRIAQRGDEVLIVLDAIRIFAGQPRRHARDAIDALSLPP